MDKVKNKNKIDKKKSNLCIGIDLTLKEDEKLNFALDLIDQTHEFAVAYKPNRQFWLGFTLDDMQQITNRIKKYDCISIMDHKLSDIGSTNKAALDWTKQEGFDYITVSPFPGNLRQTFEYGNQIGIGIIALTWMSNPEYLWINQLNESIIDMSSKYAHGIVVGTTSSVNSNVIRMISDVCDSQFVLAPGIGFQGGDHKFMSTFFNKSIIFSVSRGISLAENPYESAMEYYHLLNK